jgi:DNA ligase (NAD+)
MPIPEAVQKEINHLREQLTAAARAYYRDGISYIADADYDEMYQRLLNLETRYPDYVVPDSPTQRVGATVSEGFTKIRHGAAMLSLDNCFLHSDLMAFHQRVLKMNDSPVYIAEPKYDGLSLKLQYDEAGMLKSASTRGDGYVGEDVTVNARAIQTVPLSISAVDPAAVIGEVVLNKANFERLNKARIAEGKAPWVNPRNAAAGGLKQLDPAETAARCLDFHAYGIDTPCTTETEMLELLDAEGFMTPRALSFVGPIEAIAKHFEYLKEHRSMLPFEIDGMVVKVFDQATREKMGASSHAPRWATAYKFPAEERTAVVLSIECGVGSAGTVTPVANIEPTFVGGVTVSRVSLHNFDQVEAMDIRVGDTVFVRRAGDVVPKITAVVLDSRPADATPYIAPTKCPVCGIALIRKAGVVAVTCPNTSCPGKLKAWLTKFVARDIYDIDGFGEKLAEALVDNGSVKAPYDIFNLTEKDLLAVDGFGEKSAAKMFATIQSRKIINFERFLMGLNIPLLGHHASKLLAANYTSLDDLLNALDVDALAEGLIRPASIDGLGTVVVENITTGVLVLEATGQLDKWTDIIGIRYPQKAPAAVGAAASGKTYVVTGTLSESRDIIHQKIIAAGGLCSGSVTKKTDFLVCGDKAGSKKTKAEKLGIEIITEAELLTHLTSTERTVKL